MLSELIKDSLSKLNAIQLRKLIDYCLQNEQWLLERNLPLATHDPEKISEYIDVLETKFPPKPVYLPPKTIQDYRKESEIRISAKRKEYEQKIASKKKIIDESAIIINELETQLAGYQRKVRETSTESAIYDRLMYWKLKMQNHAQNLDESDNINLETKIENVKNKIILAKELQLKLKSELENSEVKNLFDVFLDTENRWVSMKEAENPEKQAQKEYKIKIEQYNSQRRIHLKIINNLRSEVINFVQKKTSTQKLIPTQILNWKLLPTGEIPFHYLKNYLQEVSKYSKEDFDFEKIEKIINLNADKIYCGIDDFNGYLVFLFEELGTAVLDCPKKGNAIYIFGEDWKKLSRLSKFELLNYHSSETERIIHRGDWFERLELFLKTRKRNSRYD